MGILFRYQIQEQLKSFSVAMSGIMIILISNLLLEVGNQILVKKIEAYIVIKMLIYKLPSFFVIALPVASLFGAILTLEKMIKNNELCIIRQIGFSSWRIMLPYLLMGILGSGVAFSFNEWVTPWANKQGDYLFRQIKHKELPVELTENIVFKENDRFIYIGNLDQDMRQFDRIIIYETEKGNLTKVISAKTGYYNLQNWVLNGGVIHEFNNEGFIKSEIAFNQFVLAIEHEPELLFERQRSPDDMTRTELKNFIADLEIRGMATNALMVSYHLKSSLPLASFLFILLGCPLAIKQNLKNRYIGVVITFAIMMFYFTIVSFVAASGRLKLLDPMLAAWLPNIIFFIIGIIEIWWVDNY